MARGPCTFKQRDVTAALKSAIAAGLAVARYEIDRQGKIVVFATGDNSTYASATGIPNEWDDVK